MRARRFTQLTAACLIATIYTPSMAEDTTVSPDKIIAEFESIFGVNPGHRRNHTEGLCAQGEFVGAKEATAFSKSILFNGKKIPVIARFSLAGGNINAPDTSKSPRGMALEFALSKSSIQHMTMLNVPMFGAATPQSFYDGMLAGRVDPATGKADPEKIKAFRASHPDSQPLAAFMGSHNPPVSYANSDFYSIHTFKMLNKKNKVTLVRWRFEPEDGVQRLTDDEMKSGPSSFLEKDFLSKVSAKPIRWKMILTVGEPDDVQDNPTVLWPAGRKEIQAGVLTLTSAAKEAGASCEKINFDPLVMGDGIAPTNDPVLLYRSPAYALSFAKRISNQ
ncbi:catalase family peroxidase [Undibacterium sp. RuRC25W]|uniref:catalase family peroxidase n=1 Tax=Undibacterium sp. RuRC25W TaxID=3413047 RepID=UPI003BF414DD